MTNAKDSLSYPNNRLLQLPIANPNNEMGVSWLLTI